jgi:hypothetical protein
MDASNLALSVQYRRGYVEEQSKAKFFEQRAQQLSSVLRQLGLKVNEKGEVNLPPEHMETVRVLIMDLLNETVEVDEAQG